jgi:NAD(P)-dependent dehydrogenase (short-subunit alcohol dehydrogenase family)
MRLIDKVALITGGGRGIGRAVALAYAREGAHVVVAARTQPEVEAVAGEIGQLGCQALAVTCDVADENQVKTAVARTIDRFGRIDVLVNNAGISSMRPIYAIPLAAWERTLAVNLTGSFLFTKHVWKSMQGNQPAGGAIINVSSLGGRKGYPLLAAYCASKWGQIGLTMTAAEEGKPHNIRVNAIAPGKGDTAFRAQIREDKTAMLTADDHAGICVFLASDEARFITGQVIEIEWFGAPADLAAERTPRP